MKCAKLNLQERRRERPKSEPRYDKPRRYCEKVLVDSQFEENNSWTDKTQSRFHCTEYEKSNSNRTMNNRNNNDASDMFLTVQTLQFKGESQQSKRTRRSFKYKTLNSGQKHRMFVKQIVDGNVAHYDGERASELTCYYHDYANYFINNNRSRSSSAKSSILHQNIHNNLKRNKSVQVDFKNFEEIKYDKTSLAIEEKKTSEVKVNEATNFEELNNNSKDDEAKIAFHKHGKRKSITISKTETPETVQVIRVDLICNYNCSSTNINNEENNTQYNGSQSYSVETRMEDVNLRRKHYGNKYLLTKSVKALDENFSGGTNVTLFCKTFRLTNRKKCSTNKNS